MNKRLLLTTLVLCIAVLIVGCRPKIEFEGVENRRFHRDLVKLRAAIIESMKEDKYKKDEIEKILSKMNNNNYKKKLNATELALLESLNEVEDDLERDIGDGDDIIDGKLLDKVNWLLQLVSEDEWKEMQSQN